MNNPSVSGLTERCGRAAIQSWCESELDKSGFNALEGRLPDGATGFDVTSARKSGRPTL